MSDETTAQAREYDHVGTLEAMTGAFRMFAMLASTVTPADVAEAKTTVQRASTFGGFVDPTAYMRALHDGRLDRQEALVALFDKTCRGLDELFPKGWRDGR